MCPLLECLLRCLKYFNSSQDQVKEANEIKPLIDRSRLIRSVQLLKNEAAEQISNAIDGKLRKYYIQTDVNDRPDRKYKHIFKSFKLFPSIKTANYVEEIIKRSYGVQNIEILRSYQMRYPT